LLARFAALVGLFVQRSGFAGWSSSHADCAHDHRPRGRPFGDGEKIAGHDCLGGFGAPATDVDVAAGNRIGGEAAGLEEARGPQPLVQASGIEALAGAG
jgi:hypothetical protein